MTDNSAPNTTLADPRAESAVLGSILIDPDCIENLATSLHADDFWVERNQIIYAAMLNLHGAGRAIDFVTLIDALEGQGELETIGGPAYLTDLAGATPTSINAAHYAAIVFEHRLKRDLANAASIIARAAFDPTVASAAAINQAHAAIDAVAARQPNAGLVHIKEPVKLVVENVEAAQASGMLTNGIPTGFTMLDRLLGGLQRQDLIYVGGRPSMGKTALAINIAQNIANREQPVAFFSLEMSNEQLAERLLATNSKIDTHRLRIGQVHDEEWPELLEAANLLARIPLYVDDTPAATLFTIRSACHRLMAETGELALVVIDYIGLMSAAGRTENRQQEMSLISRSLKSLARELNVPILVVSQLSRALETRADKEPMLSDLRESGSLEQDADVVMFLYRDDYYNEASTEQNIAQVIVAKHRKGATGRVSLYFRKELTAFHDLEIVRTELEY